MCITNKDLEIGIKEMKNINKVLNKMIRDLDYCKTLVKSQPNLLDYKEVKQICYGKIIVELKPKSDEKTR